MGIILSMAKLRAGISSGDTFLAIDYLGSDQQDQDKAPHVHVIKKGDRVATIRLDSPFKVTGDIDNNVRREAHYFISNNVGYLHYVFDVMTHNFYSRNEYCGPQNSDNRNRYIERFRTEFPNIPIDKAYLE